MSGSRRGVIERTERGWTIKPALWSEPKALPLPDARLERGRVVRVTFDFILDATATRDEIDEQVYDGLNGEFDLLGQPTLEDIGLRTDRADLTEEVLRQPSLKRTPALTTKDA